MIDVDVSLYLVTRARLARLQKLLRFTVLPRLREFVKVRNREQGDYFAFTVVQITHREGGSPELWLQLTTFDGGRSVTSFIEDGELDDYLTGYRQEGWAVASVVPNRVFRDDGTSVWSALAAWDKENPQTDAPADGVA